MRLTLHHQWQKNRMNQRTMRKSAKSRTKSSLENARKLLKKRMKVLVISLWWHIEMKP